MGERSRRRTVITRRHFVGTAAAFAGGLFTSIGSGQAGALASGGDSRQAPVVKTSLGRLQGLWADGVWNYRGIPFAEAPVGDLRFRAPVAAKGWTGVRQAVEFAPAAMQEPGGGKESEDCLYLNVSVPQGHGDGGNGPFPVYVWIHGGANVGGRSSGEARLGVRFAQEGVVMVTLAYRLGVFGFMDMEPLLGAEYAGSQNNGLRDMLMGLRWVSENIEAFGGDPARVTIGGESAGAKAVADMMSLEEADGMFQSVVSESGGGITVLTREQGKAVAEEYGREAKAAGLGDLRKADAEKMIALQTEFVKKWPGDFPFRPEVDGRFLTKRPIERIAGGSGMKKRLLLGTNRDESALFLQGGLLTRPLTQQSLANVPLVEFEKVMARYAELYPEMSEGQRRIRAVTAEEYWVPSVRMADAHARTGGATWMYRFDYPAATGALKGEAYHSEEIRFAFGKEEAGDDAGRKKLTEEMHAAWVAFVKGGAPAATGLPEWPEYDPERRRTMVLNVDSAVQEKPLEDELRLWAGVL